MRPVTAKIWEFRFNISALAEAGDLKFSVQLGFARAHRKITPRRKIGRGPRLGELPKIWGFHFNICATAEASDLKICKRLGFSKAHHKTPPIKNVVWPWARGIPQNMGFPLIFLQWLKLATSNLM